MMNKYSMMSDDAVNAMVFISLYGEGSLKDKDMRRYFSRVDYCNNPADAMPIIIENRIAFIPTHKIEAYYCSDAKGDYYSVNKSLYRAAMEVFLMMKDAESNN